MIVSLVSLSDLMIKLYVNNGKDEYVCDIKSQISGVPTQLVVRNYTREAYILKARSGFSFVPAAESDKKKFSGFSKYLLDREKVS